MSSKDPIELNIKLILVGDTNVGKTTLLNNYLENGFSEDITPTIGLENKVKTIDIHGLKAKIQIWDTAGQEKFNALTQQYFRNADGILLVFDLTNKNSFEHIKDWCGKAKKNSDHKSKMLLVGNKRDLKDEKKISEKEINGLTHNGKKLKYIEASAKQDDNIWEIFETLINSIVGKKSNEELIAEFGINDQPLSLSGSTLVNTTNENKKKCCK